MCDAQLSLRVVDGFPVMGLNTQPSVPKASVLASTPRLHRYTTQFKGIFVLMISFEEEFLKNKIFEL